MQSSVTAGKLTHSIDFCLIPYLILFFNLLWWWQPEKSGSWGFWLCPLVRTECFIHESCKEMMRKGNWAQFNMIWQILRVVLTEVSMHTCVRKNLQWHSTSHTVHWKAHHYMFSVASSSALTTHAVSLLSSVKCVWRHTVSSSSILLQLCAPSVIFTMLTIFSWHYYCIWEGDGKDEGRKKSFTTCRWWGF